ncbi:hypothetical protein AFGD_012631 [Aspergillus flavus]|nr:hypothetical protein AFGD_012631 [Aspergillus flavus]
MYFLDLPLGLEPPSITIHSTFTGNVQGKSPSHPEISNKLVLPQPERDEVVVQNLGGTINPNDWKFPIFCPAPGARIGCDFYGEVMALGPHAKSRRPDIYIGSRVCGVVYGSISLQPTSGASCDYLTAVADLGIVVLQSYPPNDAVALSGAAFLTLSLALWRCIGLVGTPSRPLDGIGLAAHVIVYGASTSTGTVALQLSKLSGYSPIAVCSPCNFALVRDRAADAVFDYSSPSCVDDIKTYTKDSLRHALDIIADKKSRQIGADPVGATGGVCTVLRKDSSDPCTKTKSVRFNYLVAVTWLGREVDLHGPYHRAADPAVRLHVGK